jgi:hypothetical protein
VKNWTQIIKSHHSWAHPGDEYELVLGAPASEKNIADIEDKLGIQFPKEFKDVYRNHNGFGFTNKEQILTWSILPLNDLPSLFDKMHFWFGDEFPDVASRFFPFFDWLDGGAFGYLVSKSGNLEPFLYSFHPEQLNPDFDWDDPRPLIQECHSIEDFLLQR